MINVENILKQIERKNLFKRLGILLISSFLLALTYNLFLLPNNIVTGGTSGISIILSSYIPPYLLIVILNTILLIIGWFVLGKHRIVGSLIETFTFPLFVKLTENIDNYIHISNSDMMLTVLVAGTIIGFAIGSIVKAGFSTSGTGIAAQIVARAFKISTGKAHIIIDGIIILGGVLTFGVYPTLYALVALYVFTLVSDKVILGTSSNKIFYIITSKEQDVKDYILKSLNHGVTLLRAEGGYGKTKQNVLLCVVPARHYFKLKEGISVLDPTSFFIVSDAYEVKGGS